ncbi:branched-chain amino acid aminotransferase [Amycolatopsis lurida]
MSTATTSLAVHPVEFRLPAAERAARLRRPAFGSVFTEHMVSARWTAERGWHEAELRPYAPIEMPPSMVGLHYGQVVFEGLKAFRGENGEVALFRPDEHAERFRNSARRLMMPPPPVELFLEAAEELVRQDQDWLPADPNMSLYLRPILFASEADLGLRPAVEYRLLMMAFVTEGFFGSTLRPVTVWLSEDYTRVAAGGTGAAKCAGNYAGAYAAQAQAAAHGCDQVVWLDPVERKWVEELGGMNLFFVLGEGERASLLTPPLTGTILPGITRASLLTLAGDVGIPVREERISAAEWRDACRSGEITEVFACGTGARVCPVGEVRSTTDSWTVPGRGTVTARLAEQLFGIQRGTRPDNHGWLHHIGERGVG